MRIYVNVNLREREEGCLCVQIHTFTIAILYQRNCTTHFHCDDTWYAGILLCVCVRACMRACMHTYMRTVIMLCLCIHLCRGKPQEKCPLCQTCYFPEFKGTVCKVCQVCVCVVMCVCMCVYVGVGVGGCVRVWACVSLFGFIYCVFH